MGAGYGMEEWGFVLLEGEGKEGSMAVLLLMLLLLLLQCEVNFPIWGIGWW